MNVPETQTIQLNADGPLDSEMTRLLREAIRRSRGGGVTRLLDGDRCVAEISPPGIRSVYANEARELNVSPAEAERFERDINLVKGAHDRAVSELVRKPYSGFRYELENLINVHSVENGSNTPDFLLSYYLIDCLVAFDRITKARDEWYGVRLEPGNTYFHANPEDHEVAANDTGATNDHNV